MLIFILFGTVAMLVEHCDKHVKAVSKPKTIKGLAA
jgi:hypothetical protein